MCDKKNCSQRVSTASPFTNPELAWLSLFRFIRDDICCISFIDNLFNDDRVYDDRRSTRNSLCSSFKVDDVIIRSAIIKLRDLRVSEGFVGSLGMHALNGSDIKGFLCARISCLKSPETLEKANKENFYIQRDPLK